MVNHLRDLVYSGAGEVSEWLKVPLSKSGVVMSHRGFESHPLRQDNSRYGLVEDQKGGRTTFPPFIVSCMDPWMSRLRLRDVI